MPIETASPSSFLTRCLIASAICRMVPCKDSKPVTSRYASSSPIGSMNGEKSARIAINFSEASRYLWKLPSMKIACGQRRTAVANGIPECKPKTRASRKRGNDAAPVGFSPHHHRFAFQFRLENLFHRDKERIHVSVHDCNGHSNIILAHMFSIIPPLVIASETRQSLGRYPLITIHSILDMESRNVNLRIPTSVGMVIYHSNEALKTPL